MVPPFQTSRSPAPRMGRSNVAEHSSNGTFLPHFNDTGDSQLQVEHNQRLPKHAQYSMLGCQENCFSPEVKSSAQVATIGNWKIVAFRSSGLNDRYCVRHDS